LKKNSRPVQFLNKIFYLFILYVSIFLSDCSYKKTVSLEEFPKEVKEIFEGTIWWEIIYFSNNETKAINGYGEFQISKDFLFLRLKSPLSTTLGYGKWTYSSFEIIEIFDFYNKKHYLVLLNQDPELQNIPLYFLGLKESEKNFIFLKTTFKYSFSQTDKEGIITSEFFTLKWRFKNIHPVKTFSPLIKENFFNETLPQIEVIF